ncbi:MAG: PKD domain-containing protein [Gemmatimonadales bacterium]
MRIMRNGALAAMVVAGIWLAGCSDELVEPTTAIKPSPAIGATAVANRYAVDFVSTAATGWDMNDAGDVVGRSYRDNGCGSFCLPPEDIVVWKGGQRIPLPLVPGFSSSYQFPFFLNNQGLIGGEVGLIGSTTDAAVWTPNGTGYTAQDLGVFPGATSAEVFGLDDQGRMVGWSTKGGAIPTFAVPFMWTRAGGFVDLAAQGYPNEVPGGMSPGGKVVTTSSHWYQLGNPASVVAMPAPPPSFFGFGRGIINDNGDQAHFLGTGTQGLIYPFRLSNGVWQQLSGIPTGRLSRAGLGSINLANDVTFTAGSTGLIAAGPSGVGQPLAALLSPAYPGATVGEGGPMNNAGQILTKVMIGRSQRLMKMTPVSACGANCLVSSSLVMTGLFVQDPAFPGSCFQGGKMYNRSTARVTIVDETGAPLANVVVRGRFLDDYWTNNPVTGTSNASGVVTWTYQGLCGVGAIAFLVEQATLGSRTFDRTRGVLSNWVIPSATTNQPPVASFTSSCSNATRVCSFSGTGSTDDAGIVSYSWTFGDGTTGTGPTPSHTYAVAGSYQVTLTVTDGGGLTNSLTRTVTLGAATNRPPIAAWTVTCQPAPAHACTFDGTSSRDPDGTIVGYLWTNAGKKTVSTLARFTRTFERPMTLTWTLTVTDNGGKTGTLSKTFTVP